MIVIMCVFSAASYHWIPTSKTEQPQTKCRIKCLWLSNNTPMTTEQILNCYEMRQRALEALFIGITFCRIWLQKLCCGFCTHLSKCFATTCNNTQHVDRISKNTLSPNTSASACLPPASRSNVFESVRRCFFLQRQIPEALGTCLQ